MSTPNIRDLESLFYGNGESAKYAVLQAFAEAGVDAMDLLGLVGQQVGDNASIHAGDGVPDAEFGDVDDFYIDTATGDQFLKSVVDTSTWGEPLAVADGPLEAPPDDEDGVDGDFAAVQVDDVWSLYRRVAGVWVEQTPLDVAEGAPSDDAPGVWYLDLLDGDVYSFTESSVIEWVAVSIFGQGGGGGTPSAVVVHEAVGVGETPTTADYELVAGDVGALVGVFTAEELPIAVLVPDGLGTVADRIEVVGANAGGFGLVSDTATLAVPVGFLAAGRDQYSTVVLTKLNDAIEDAPESWLLSGDLAPDV